MQFVCHVKGPLCGFLEEIQTQNVYFLFEVNK